MMAIWTAETCSSLLYQLYGMVCVVLIVATVSGFLWCATRCTGVEFLIVVSFVSALQHLAAASLLATGGACS